MSYLFIDKNGIEERSVAPNGTVTIVTDAKQEPMGPKCNHLWPHVSNSMAVMPNQVQERLQACAKAGVPTEHTRQGQPILRTPQHQKDFAERVMGFIGECGNGKHAYGRR